MIKCFFVLSRAWYIKNSESHEESNLKSLDSALLISFYSKLIPWSKTNRQWFSMVCTLIDNNIRYQST